MDRLIGADAWPPSQPPPATGHPRPAPTLWRATGTRKPRLGGPLLPLGDALLGQHLAEPRMLVAHDVLPSCSSACLFRRPGRASVVAGRLRMVLRHAAESGTCPTAKYVTSTPSYADLQLQMSMACAGRPKFVTLLNKCAGLDALLRRTVEAHAGLHQASRSIPTVP